MREFGKLHFKEVAYINFDNNERMKILFEGDYNINRIIDGLQVEAGIRINPKTTLIIFDEVQEVPKALSSLKYFYESTPEYSIIAAGSLLGVALHQGTSFPVGKVEFFNLYPMSFYEFLLASKEESLAKLLMENDWDLIAAFHTKYVDLLRRYFYVGGMPEVVYNYVENYDYDNVREIQQQIILSYEQDFSKHVPINLFPRLQSLWRSIPAQLAKENKKFSPGLVQKGARLKDYELAIQWLLDCGLIHKIPQISKPELPLKSYETNFFKLFINDIGLLGALSELDVKTLLEGNKIFQEFKGSLTEQFVLQEMVSRNITAYYWSSTGNAEVDFVLKHDSNVYPLEVKAEENLQSKSLKVYYERYNPLFALRTSMKSYREESWMKNIPLYAIGTDFIKSSD
jgi:predicted AAA+ superfamily ATPase